MKRLLTSCLGLGWMPVASGTWGSLPPAVTLAVLGWSGCSLATQHWVQWLWLIYGCVACVALAPAAIASTGKKDPGEVVVDEVAGQAVTFLVWLWLPVGTWTPMQWVVIAAAGFLLFRVFDIFKPTPAHQLESLPRGWGILADDLMGGIYAGLVLVAGCWVVQHLQTGGLPGLSQTLDLKAAIVLGSDPRGNRVLAGFPPPAIWSF